jgi:hypothetical protein
MNQKLKQQPQSPMRSTAWGKGLSFSLFLLVALTGFNCSKTQQQEGIVPVTEGTKAVSQHLERTAPDLQAVYADEKFLAACEILAADGEMFLESSAVQDEVDGASQITFDVVNEETQAPGVYPKLVYARSGDETLVYFDGTTMDDGTIPKSGAFNGEGAKWPPRWWPGGGGGSGGGGGGGGICWNWGGWQFVAQYCDFRFFCFFRWQRALYQDQKRVCNTNPSNVQTRTIKISCGC